jgi:hypothetical protein
MQARSHATFVAHWTRKNPTSHNVLLGVQSHSNFRAAPYAAKSDELSADPIFHQIGVIRNAANNLLRAVHRLAANLCEEPLHVERQAFLRNTNAHPP